MLELGLMPGIGSVHHADLALTLADRRSVQKVFERWLAHALRGIALFEFGVPRTLSDCAVVAVFEC